MSHSVHEFSPINIEIEFEAALFGPFLLCSVMFAAIEDAVRWDLRIVVKALVVIVVFTFI